MLPLAIALAFAADPNPRFPLFVAHSTAADVAVGTLAKLEPDFAVTMVEPDAKIPAGDLVSLRRAEKPLPPAPRLPHVRLANGDFVRTKEVSADGDLFLRLDALLGSSREPQPIRVPVTAVSAVWFTAPPADTPPDPAGYTWFDPTQKQDAMLLRNGDVVRGTLEKIGDGAEGVVRFKPAGDEAAKSYVRSVVAAVAFNPSLTRVRKPKAAYTRVTTADGSRITMTAVASDDRTLSATTATGAKVTLPLADVIAIDVFGGKATYLSDLTPKAQKLEPYGAVEWPWAADRSVKGQPLRLKTVLGEEVFAKGVGLHPRTTLTYDLGGKYKRFEATVGLDAVTGRRGAVDVRILVDGNPQTIDGLTGLGYADGVRVLGVDVANAKELTIVVDFGPGGDVHDDVNFADARLIE